MHAHERILLQIDLKGVSQWKDKSEHTISDKLFREINCPQKKKLRRFFNTARYADLEEHENPIHVYREGVSCFRKCFFLGGGLAKDARV